MIRLSAVGDVVRTLPALSCLRRAYPAAHIDWAVEDAARGILEAQPDLDGVLVFPRSKLARVVLHPDEATEAFEALSRFIGSLKEARYDLVIDFQGTLKTGIMSRMTGAPRQVGLGRGHAREMAYLFYNDRADLPRKMNRVDRSLALVAHLGVSTAGATSSIPGNAEDAAYVEMFLSTLPKQGEEQLAPAVIFPGTSRTQAYKRYPPQNFAKAADALADKTGSPIVVAWGPGEEDLAGDVIDAMSSPATLAPKLTLGQLTELIRRSRVFIAGDTGPMHIAWTVGAPVVAVYGPTDPVLNHPGGPFSAVAYQKVFCSPCRNRGCIARTCLERLDPETVAQTALDVIEKAREAGRSGRQDAPQADLAPPRHETIRAGGSGPRRIDS